MNKQAVVKRILKNCSEMTGQKNQTILLRAIKDMLLLIFQQLLLSEYFYCQKEYKRFMFYITAAKESSMLFDLIEIERILDPLFRTFNVEGADQKNSEIFKAAFNIHRFLTLEILILEDGESGGIR